MTNPALRIDRDVCFGSANCVEAAPEVFDIDAEGYARLVGDPSDLDAETLDWIVRHCPSGALTLAPSLGGARSGAE